MTWNLPAGEAFLPHVSQTRLKKLAAKEKNAKAKTRLLVAFHRKQGKSIDDIAENTLLHRRAVHDILHRFIERGITAAKSLPKSGRKSQLSNQQFKRLKRLLIKGPRASAFDSDFWNGKMIAELIRKTFSVTYTSRHVTRVLLKLEYSYKKPRPFNPRRASRKKIAEFKKKSV